MWGNFGQIFVIVADLTDSSFVYEPGAVLIFSVRAEIKVKRIVIDVSMRAVSTEVIHNVISSLRSPEPTFASSTNNLGTS